MTLGRIGYEAYARTTGGKTFDGRDMPKWTELPDRIRTAWEVAAQEIGCAIEDAPESPSESEKT